jgi:Uma2 family endonuclease
MSTIMQQWPRRHRITVDDYYRMAEAGLFDPGERVELIDGEIIDMPPMGSRHGGNLAQLADLLVAAVGAQAMVRQRLPVHLSDDSEPEPDIALVRPRADYYRLRHPTAADVLLLVEVSDTTLRYDLDVKVPFYARHGVVEVWVVDLPSRQIHSNRDPVNGRYTTVASTPEPGATRIGALPDCTIDLSPLRG